MKKIGLVAFICISMILTVTACGSEVKTNKPVEEETTTELCKQEEGTIAAAETEDKEETEVQTTEIPTIEDVLKDTSWELVMEETFDFKCHDALCYNGNVALAVGYAGEIHYLQDSDATWPRAENASLCRFGLDFIDENICYTCGNTNITKSVDGGRTFVKKTDFANADMSTMISFIDENTGIVAGKKQMGITKDGAETWTAIDVPGTAEIICIKMETADIFYYIDAKLTLYRTEDGGANWETIPLNLPEGEDYIPIRKNVDITAAGDGSYTIYCVQKSTKMIKSYTTSDYFATYTENEMPLLNAGACYLRVEGDYITMYNATNKSMTVIKKK